VIIDNFNITNDSDDTPLPIDAFTKPSSRLRYTTLSRNTSLSRPSHSLPILVFSVSGLWCITLRIALRAWLTLVR